MFNMKLVYHYYKDNSTLPYKQTDQIIRCDAYSVFHEDGEVVMALQTQEQAETGCYEAHYVFMNVGEDGLARAYVMNENFKTLEHIFKEM